MAGFLIAVSFCIFSSRQNIAQGSDAEDNVWAVINYDDDDGSGGCGGDDDHNHDHDDMKKFMYACSLLGGLILELND